MEAHGHECNGQTNKTFYETAGYCDRECCWPPQYYFTLIARATVRLRAHDRGARLDSRIQHTSNMNSQSAFGRIWLSQGYKHRDPLFLRLPVAHFGRTDGRTDGRADGRTDGQTERERERQRDRETERQRDKETERQRDRERRRKGRGQGRRRRKQEEGQGQVISEERRAAERTGRARKGRALEGELVEGGEMPKERTKHERGEAAKSHRAGSRPARGACHKGTSPRTKQGQPLGRD